jgi:hypothetical protein
MGASPVHGWMSCARSGSTRANERPWPAQSLILKRSLSSIEPVKGSWPRCEVPALNSLRLERRICI